MNKSNTKILEYIIKQRKGHYCHALELSSYYEYENVIESLITELSNQFTQADFIAFFDTIEIYYFTGDMPEYEEEEEQLYNFNHAKFIKDFI